MKPMFYLPNDWWLFLYYVFTVAGLTNVLVGIFKGRSYEGVSYQTFSVYVLWSVTTFTTYFYPDMRLPSEFHLLVLTGVMSMWITALYFPYRQTYQRKYDIKSYGACISLMIIMLYFLEKDFSKVLELSALSMSITLHIPQVVLVLESKKINLYILGFLIHLFFAKIFFLLHTICYPRYYVVDLIHGILGLLLVIVFIPLFWISDLKFDMSPFIEKDTKNIAQNTIKLEREGRLHPVDDIVTVVSHKQVIIKKKVQQKQQNLPKPDSGNGVQQKQQDLPKPDTEKGVQQKQPDLPKPHTEMVLKVVPIKPNDSMA
ncbi:uncharacterized protein LOC114326530 [Diabrotica virgifera virgifera]|uniref:Uncharacterized protein n=1 Tax=Diabrotica virgifera virgifera TaxID=50390 RepID=A0ABM5IDZ6_DIAVI|nr:uncharacterized protein LOC114326530 [Diabrotica virgifera virgifera]